jgi:hypothetical protein
MLSATILLVEIYLSKGIGIRNLLSVRLICRLGVVRRFDFCLPAPALYSNGGVLFNAGAAVSSNERLSYDPECHFEIS